MSYSWKKTLISEKYTIMQGLEVINNEALKIAIVIDKTKKILGVVTDGDIRRGLLKGLQLTDSINKVMNTKPIIALQGTPKETLISLMRINKILSIPILNNNEQIVDLATLHSELENKKHQNPVFIMAGGFGTRLRPLTDNCPKPMLKVGGKPILETTLRSFIKAGFSNFYISTHYMPELIKKHFGDGKTLGINISYIHEEDPLGTGGALGLLCKDCLQDLPLIMINGDILTKVNYSLLLNFHNENQADATMCVREYDYQIPFGVVNGKDNRITGMVEKPTHRYFVNAGIYVLSPQIINSVKRNQKIDMTSLLENRMKENKKILMFPIYEYWLDIGRIDDFNRAQNDIHLLEI